MTSSFIVKVLANAKMIISSGEVLTYSPVLCDTQIGYKEPLSVTLVKQIEQKFRMVFGGARVIPACLYMNIMLCYSLEITCLLIFIACDAL